MISRRDVLQNAVAAFGVAGMPGAVCAQDRYDQQHLLAFDPVGQVTLIHLGDLFGQRHPHVMRPSSQKTSRAEDAHLPEHLTDELLRIRFGIGGRQPMDYALTHRHFSDDAQAYGPMGGVRHITTVVDAIRAQRPGAVLIGDLDPDGVSGRAEAVTRRGVSVAIVNLVAAVKVPDQIAQAKAAGAQVVVCKSYLGSAADRLLAAQVSDIDVIFCMGDAPAFPGPIRIGDTYLIASGTQGRFVARVDLDVQEGGIKAIAHRLIPVFSDLIDPTPVAGLAPADARVLGHAGALLYRRGVLDSTWDDLICQALQQGTGAPIALVPGLQHGASVLPGAPVTAAALQSVVWGQRPVTYVSTLRGEVLKQMLEDAAEAVFHADALHRTKGAMMRARGVTFAVDPDASSGARIGNVRLADGAPLDPQARYRVAHWGLDVAGDVGPPIADVVAEFLKPRTDLTPD